MSIYLMDFTTFVELFAFDAETGEETQLEVDWTEKPIETGAVISEYGIHKPEVFPVEGVVTAWPLGLPRDPTRIGTTIGKLRTLAKRKLPVWLVTDDLAEEVVLAKVNSKRSAGEGEQTAISLECRAIESTKPTTVTIPPSRLKASVKSSTALKAKGGSSAGSAAAYTTDDVLVESIVDVITGT